MKTPGHYITRKHKKMEKWREGTSVRNLETWGTTQWLVPLLLLHLPNVSQILSRIC
jgi:hypothetical protein